MVDLDAKVPEMAKKALLTTKDVRMWLQHLQDVTDRRIEGAEKANATRNQIILIVGTLFIQKLLFLPVMLIALREAFFCDFLTVLFDVSS